MEDPGNSNLRQLLDQRHAQVLTQPVDHEGLVVDARLARADLVYVTPSHQIPTAAVMTRARREALLESASEHDFVIVEDDYECEINYLDHPQPALRGMDDADRVIYVASLSNVLASGVQLGFIVADAEFIRHARELRSTMLGHPPLNNQRAVAFFLSLGHYDALMARLARTLQERRLALRDALNFYRSVSIEISPEVGGTTYWVRLPPDFNVEHLASEAERRGILIEPVARYYADPGRAENCFRMGVTSLPLERIRPGVVELTELIRVLVSGRVEHLETSVGRWLTDEELRAAMANKTIIYNVVYGVPCTIDLHADGTMIGTAGYANEDCDTGRWWVDGDRWHRQWKQWVYGEEAAYYVVIHDDHIKWFNETHQLVDSAFIRTMVAPD
jgi:GntR family transcriptional regulator / MocR family aminotransferase